MADLKYDTYKLDLNKIDMVCDDCLKVCKVRRAGKPEWGCAYLTKCECGDREWEVRASEFVLREGRNRVLISAILRPADRKPGTYSGHDKEKRQALLEVDTGIFLEDVTDLDLFMQTTDSGRLPFQTLENSAMRLFELYKKFKDVPHHTDIKPSERSGHG